MHKITSFFPLWGALWTNQKPSRMFVFQDPYNFLRKFICLTIKTQYVKEAQKILTTEPDGRVDRAG